MGRGSPCHCFGCRDCDWGLFSQHHRLASRSAWPSEATMWFGDTLRRMAHSILGKIFCDVGYYVGMSVTLNRLYQSYMMLWHFCEP